MAAEGRNEVARSLLDLQPTAIVELYRLRPDTTNSPNLSVYFHGGSMFGKNITWQGVEYIPVPIESEGFGVFGDGTLPRPKIKVSNNNKLVTFLLGKYKDFKNAAISRTKVFVKHLDDVNFDGQNPFGLSNPESEISTEKYLIGQKVQENKAFVEFELNLPLDLDNFDINYRTVNAKYCYWTYRGLGCQYEAKPVEQEDGSAFVNVLGERVTVDATEEMIRTGQLFYEAEKTYNAGEPVYLENSRIIVGREQDSEPIFHKTWYVCVSGNSGQHPEDNSSFWQKDGCSKKIEACQKRFTSDSLKRISLGDEETGFNYLHLDGEEGATLATLRPDVTGVFNQPEWTVSLWMRGDKQFEDSSGNFTHPTVFATKALPRTNKLFNPVDEGEVSTSGSFTNRVTANLHFSSAIQGQEDQKGLFLELSAPQVKNDRSYTKRIPTKIASSEHFHCVILRGFSRGSIGRTRGHIEILVNPHKNQYGTFSYSSKVDMRSNRFNLGVDFFSIFGEATGVNEDPVNQINKENCFGGDIAQVCVWGRKLSNDEVTWIGAANSVADSEYYLTDNGLQKRVDLYCDYAPLSYGETTGYLSSLRTDLKGWYDMTTATVSGKFLSLDESDGDNHLTGFGDTNQFETRRLDYTVGKFEQFIANQNALQPLPFGGFPGTDGFDYKALGSQNI